MVVEDPVVLTADERGDRRRRDAGEDLGAADADPLQVAEQRFVMTELLVDVLLEIRRKRRSERIVEAARLRERRLGQRHRRADDLVLEDQILGPELA
jgi:hypothetical protein